ncbi:MAG: oligosaccharide flippase family protein [Bacilli bacterium]|nr:oligosaccharide flippase family protein [Bacilli bacterium]
MKISLRFNAILRILLTACNIVIPIIIGPYIIKTLSKTSYDTYTKANVEVGLFLMLAGVSIFTYGVRSISKIRENKEEVKKTFTEIFIYSFVLTSLFSILYLLYITFINNHSGETIYYILMLQFIGSFVSVEWMNEAFEDYKFITIKSLIVKVLYVSSIFTFIKSDNLISYTYIISFTFILDNLISFIYIYRKHSLSFKGLNLKKHLKPIILIFLISNISLMYMQADKLMLGLMLSDNAVTTYTIPSYIVVSIYNVILSIFVVAIPRLNDYYHNKSKDDFRKLYNEILRTFLIIFIPLIVFVFVLSDDIIILYTSSKYLESIIPLKYFSIVILLNATVYLQREGILYVFEMEKKIIKYNLIGGIINIGLNIVLYFLGLFNPITCIITLGFSFLFLNIIMRIFVLREIDNRIVLFDTQISKYIVLSIIVVLIDYFISLFIFNLLIKLIVCFVLFIIIYLLGLIITKDSIFRLNWKICLAEVRKMKDRLFKRRV